jgi:hypothetical protein
LFDGAKKIFLFIFYCRLAAFGLYIFASELKNVCPMSFEDDMIENGFSDAMDYEEYMVNKALARQMEMIDEDRMFAIPYNSQDDD